MSTVWPTKLLADVCIVKPPKSEARQRIVGTQPVSFVPMEDLGISQKYVLPRQTRALCEVVGSYTYFADGDVLLAKITPCFENGKLGIAKDLERGVGFGSSEYIVLRPSAKLDAQWLYYFLSRDSFRAEGEARMGGAVGHKRVAKEFIETYPVPLPSLTEQQRIIAILDEAFAGIASAKANAEKNLQNARALFDAAAADVFVQGAADWSDRRLGDVCEIARGGSPRPIKAFLTDAEDGVNWIKISDASASSKYIYKTREKIKPSGVSRSRLVHSGDFLLSNSMSFGRPYILRTSGCIHDGWLVLSMYEGTFDQDFLYLLLGSQLIYRQFDRLAAGSTVRNLNIELARSVTVLVPPLKVQRALASELQNLSERVERLESIYQRKLAALDALKQSLLHQAFSGQL